MHRALRVLLPVAVLALSMSSTSLMASSNYPGEVSSHLGGDTPLPSCTVCHATNAGGIGTVTKSHGIALVGAGLVAGDVPSLRAALDTLAANGTDSDGGGDPDTDELIAGTDPNVASDDGDAGSGGEDGSLKYGFCAATPGQGSGLGLAGALGLLFVWRRLRRRAP